MNLEIKEPRVVHPFPCGVPTGPDVVVGQKHFCEIEEIYRETAGVPGDTLMYTVYSYFPECEKAGELNWGLTVMEPVTVNGECNMTRGHFHEDRDCAEFYFGLAGEGLLMLMQEDGTTVAEKIYAGSVHHIAGTVGHKIVNTGEEQLYVGACWPTTAGHDYATIERSPFPCRIMKNETGVYFVER